MGLQMSSQNTLMQRIKTTIDNKGDTLVTLPLADARVILSDLLDYRIVDSLLVEYRKRDSIQTKEISIRIKDIKALQLESINKDSQIYNLQKIVENKIKEIILNEDVIEQQKKEIRKQKFLKIGAMITAVVLPILVLIVTIR